MKHLSTFLLDNASLLKFRCNFRVWRSWDRTGSYRQKKKVVEMEGRGVNIALHVCPCSTGISLFSVSRPPLGMVTIRRAGGEGRAEGRGLDFSFTPAKHEINNDAYELKEAEDGTRTGTKRQIDLEIQVAQEDIVELRRQGLKGEELKYLKVLIAVLENEKSAMDPAATLSLDPAAPAFVPGSSVPAR